MADEITNDRDIIDSREVNDRITELENLAASDGVYVLDEDETAELAALRALAEEGKTEAADWKDGAALIRESYWADYARQLAEDIGAINREAAHDWPLSHIDWEAAAEELQVDYNTVDFDGVTYYVRA